MSTLNTLLTTGALDNAGARLLYETFEQTGRTHNHPPPAGFRTWNREAAVTAAHDFLTGTRSTERLVQIAAQAYDDESFVRLLQTTVLNYLRDVARATVVGTQVRRIKDVVADEPGLLVEGERVRLADGPSDPFGGDEVMLVRAAMKVDVTRRRWKPDAKREGPLADRADMVALVRAVLVAAEGSITFAMIARVVARRFDLDVLPVTVPLDGLDPPAASDFARIEIADQVEAVMAQLTERDKDVLPFLDESSRKAAPHIGLRHSAVALAQAKLKSLLAVVLPPGDEGVAVLRALTERVESARRSRVDS
ncbi:hypothetical protein ACFWN2_25820 [Lentzea sp. NPDC058436]|uniref:hypothetical protein n=1 Tax=Lentzea sp. NPDC058436 TaxID=3346499 RepID=UPI003663E52B